MTTADRVRASQVNDSIECHVVRIVSSGLIVALEDGRTGIIRSRELTWDRSLDAPPLTFHKDDTLQAVILSEDKKSGHLELSHKRVIAYPWKKVTNGAYREGQLVRGEVVNLVHNGAYVQLEPGIDGFVPNDQIPGGAGRQTEELLWLRDRIEAIVTRVRLDEDLLDLSILDCLEKRLGQRASRSGQTDLSFDPSRYPSSVLPASEHRAQLRQCVGQRIHRVCVIDDESDFADGLAEWLARFGYEVSTTKDSVIDSTEDRLADLYLIDVDLGETDGRDTAKTLCARQPDARIVLMTALDRLDEHESVDESLLVDGILLKPLDYEEVLDLLAELETSKPKPIDLQNLSLGQRDQSFLEYVANQPSLRQGEEISLNEALHRLRRHTGAHSAYLLRVDLFTLRISIAGCSCLSEGYLTQSQLDTLKQSVVRNIAIDKEIIRSGTISGHDRFASLLRVFNLESLIGVPIPDVGIDARYVLLLLHPEPDQFSEAHMVEALGVSHLLASYLQQEAIGAIVTKAQRSILFGQLSAGLLHELKNKINSIGQQMQNMELDLEDLADKAKGLPARLWTRDLTKRTTLMKAEYADLRTMTFENLGILGQERLISVDVNELLQKTARTVAPLAKANKVRMEIRQDQHIPRITTISLRLEQVFLNIALNAVQQMALMHSPYGSLQIATKYEGQDSEHPLTIRFTDDGPGIHKSLWEWIFDLGTTTRPDGSGLGLFVSQGLIQSLGGQVAVEQSFMFVGTTMVIRLPRTYTEEVFHA